MNASFKIFAKSRGGNGISDLLVSALAVLVAACFAFLPAVYDVTLPWIVYAVVSIVGAASCWFLVRSVVDLWRNREREFCVDGNRMIWTARDRLGEKIEGEIQLRDVRSLIYQAHEDSSPYLEVEFIDGTVSPLPFVGAPSCDSLLQFINHWRSTHPEIPIRNLNND